MHKSTLKRAEAVMAIVEQHYEAGRQDRCKLWIYRNIIARQTGISQRTFFRYLNAAGQQPDDGPKAVQLSLF